WRLGSIADIRYLNRCNRDCSHPFALPDWAEFFVGRRFHAHVRFAYADRASNFLGHRTNVRGDFWRFGDECGVDIEDARSFVGMQFRHSFQNLDAADAAKRLIRIWKMPADVARADRAEQRIRDRMRQNIRVRVSFQPVRVWNLNAAQNQLSSLRE